MLAGIKVHLDVHGFRREYVRELERSNRELEAFSYSVAHDLRTPLRGIDGFSELLIQNYGEKLDDQGRQYLDRVQSATHRMGQLIEDLLKFARITQAPLNRERVHITKLSRQILS